MTKKELLIEIAKYKRIIKKLKKRLDKNPSFEVEGRTVTTTLNGHKDEKSLERFFRFNEL